jgi:hypothetical protein
VIDFDRSEKDHSSRFRVRGVFTQPGSKGGGLAVQPLPAMPAAPPIKAER